VESSNSLRPSRLTLIQIMGAVAVMALAFASLPWVLSVALAVAMSGILGAQGLRLPLVTEGGGMRRWLPWALWCLALAASPAAMIVVGGVYQRTGPPAFTGPRPWATRVVDGLCYAHLVASVVASVSVVLLGRGGVRWLAWVAILVIGIFTCVVALGAMMSTTGVSL
jgi:hypothetical protein